MLCFTLLVLLVCPTLCAAIIGEFSCTGGRQQLQELVSNVAVEPPVDDRVGDGRRHGRKVTYGKGDVHRLEGFPARAGKNQVRVQQVDACQNNKPF